MIIRQIDKKTRLVLVRFYLPALAGAHKLQRKKWWGWKTVAWNYPSVLRRRKTVNSILDWMCWEEEDRMTEYQKGKRLINNDD